MFEWTLRFVLRFLRTIGSFGLGCFGMFREVGSSFFKWKVGFILIVVVFSKKKKLDFMTNFGKKKNLKFCRLYKENLLFWESREKPLECYDLRDFWNEG